jgi:hypothetical protein
VGTTADNPVKPGRVVPDRSEQVVRAYAHRVARPLTPHIGEGDDRCLREPEMREAESAEMKTCLVLFEYAT